MSIIRSRLSYKTFGGGNFWGMGHNIDEARL